MQSPTVSRRTLLRGGSAALAGLSVWQVSGPAEAFPGHGGDDDGEDVPWSDHPSDEYPGSPTDEVLKWLDQPGPIPDAVVNGVGTLLVWEDLHSRITPNDEFFTIKHYNLPVIDPATYQLSVDGLVDHPTTLSLPDLKARPRHEVEFTLECSGNTGTGLGFFIGGVGNARWAGARLGPILREAGVQDEGTEVVFWGEDTGTVTIRDNSGVGDGGTTGTLANGALTITERFARSMSVDDAKASPNLLCYEMNGEPLPPEHGAPVRLLAPGWYGVANVKWLHRIEVMDRRFAGRFMARDYVTFRERIVDGEDPLWTFTTVGQTLLKSAPAKVTRHDGLYTIIGVAWGKPIRRVEVSIDGGPWVKAHLGGSAQKKKSKGYAWRFWTFDWNAPSAGEHSISSRAIDTQGNVQPSPDDPSIATKHTYWESNGQITRHIVIP